MSAPKVAIDLSRNAKQAAYFNEVMAAVAGKTNKRFFAYGGAIRGGKTFVTLFILMVLCRKFPGSRWHVVRATLPDLKKTTIPSFEKLAPEGVTVHKDPGNWHATFPNGSTIFFTSENIGQDPDLKSFLGLETNGVFIEQAEEANIMLWEKAIERAGSWYIDPMPPALTFLTFNPTMEWPDQIFSDPYYKGTLEDPYLYMPALPGDNPFVTADQWEAWQQMEPSMYAAMIEGDRSALLARGKRFYWAFERRKHVQAVAFDPSLPVHLSFDQNVEPYITMTCWQIIITDAGHRLQCFDEFCLPHPNSNTEAVCKAFLAKYGGAVKAVFIYGDASGNKRDTRAGQNDYQIARNTLQRLWHSGSDRTDRSNPPVINRRDFINKIFQGIIPKVEVLIGINCTETIRDFALINQDANGAKLKTKSTDPKTKVTFENIGHTSDTADYIIIKVFVKEFLAFKGGSAFSLSYS